MRIRYKHHVVSSLLTLTLKNSTAYLEKQTGSIIEIVDLILSVHITRNSHKHDVVSSLLTLASKNSTA